MNSQLPYQKSKLILVFAGWWIVWTLVQTLVLHRLHLGWEIALTDSAISSMLLAAAGAITLNLYRFYQPGKSNRVYRFLFGIIISWLYCLALKYLLPKAIHTTDYNSFLEASIPLRFVFALLIISFITLINWLLNTINENKKKEKQQHEVEQMMKEAELARLRQQLQPHFLFNSLNSINALVTTKPEQARKMVQQLSDFLRGTLKKDDQQLSKLSDELEHLKLYLEIEKVRFGHRLNIEIDCGENTAEQRLPALLLQPVVENAIKFGLYDIPAEVSIGIKCRSDKKDLIIEVRNPFDPANQAKGTGFGLSSIRRRLYLLYMRNDLLKTFSEGNNFVTTLIIPQST